MRYQDDILKEMKCIFYFLIFIIIYYSFNIYFVLGCDLVFLNVRARGRNRSWIEQQTATPHPEIPEINPNFLTHVKIRYSSKHFTEMLVRCRWVIIENYSCSCLLTQLPGQICYIQVSSPTEKSGRYKSLSWLFNYLSHLLYILFFFKFVTLFVWKDLGYTSGRYRIISLDICIYLNFYSPNNWNRKSFHAHEYLRM